MKVQFSSFLSTIAATLSASCCVLPMVLLFIGFTSLGAICICYALQPVYPVVQPAYVGRSVLRPLSPPG